VFVGHPFAGRFPVKKFRRIFKELPFKVIYGNTDLQTEHLLDVMRASVLKSDFSIFDLSDWNPNVALELGLAQGLKKKPGKTYYIVLNTRRSENVPSDIQGVQRLEYANAEGHHVLDPQQIQATFPQFEELKSDMMRVNESLMRYRAKMRQLVMKD
jgi:hypothetical protein